MPSLPAPKGSTNPKGGMPHYLLTPCSSGMDWYDGRWAQRTVVVVTDRGEGECRKGVRYLMGILTGIV